MNNLYTIKSTSGIKSSCCKSDMVMRHFQANPATEPTYLYRCEKCMSLCLGNGKSFFQIMYYMFDLKEAGCTENYVEGAIESLLDK